jgi:hypothetical protein
MKGVQHELEDTDTFAGERMLKNNEKRVVTLDGGGKGTDYRSGRGEASLVFSARRLGASEGERKRGNAFSRCADLENRRHSSAISDTNYEVSSASSDGTDTLESRDRSRT